MSAWAGFSNSGVITVAAMFIVAKCIEVNGTIDYITRRLLGRPKNHFVAQLRFLVPVAVGSAFIANTPLVAAMIPVLASWTTRINMPVSQFMMPLSFVSMIGGMSTLLGTSTNLVAASLLEAYDPTQVRGAGEPLVINNFVKTIIVCRSVATLARAGLRVLPLTTQCPEHRAWSISLASV